MVGASALIISTFSLLLFLDFTSRIEAGDAREIGKITYKKRVSQRKYGNQVIWEDVENNTPVYINDSIRTSDLSEAVVRLQDGTSIELDENSMILLAESSGSININFAQGTMYARRAAVADPNAATVNITSGEATVSIEQSDVKLSQSEDKQLNLTVSRGTAVLKTESEEKVLTQNQNAVLLKDAKVAQVREIALRLVSPEPNRYFISPERTLPVSFAWEATGDAKDVYFELSRDRSFTAVVSRKRAAAPNAIEAVAGGEYYWRLKAEDAAGKPQFSETRRFSVLVDRPVQLVYPPSNETFSFVTRPPMINFRWGKNDIASKYTLEIAKDQSFTQPVSSVSTSLTGLGIDTLPLGTYYWRVSTTAGLGDPAYSGRSGVHRLVINRRKVVERTELISPPEGTVFSGLQIQSKGVICSWKMVGEVPRYELVVASEKEFNNIVHRDTVAGNFTRLVKELAAGTYFWKIRPLADDAEGSVFTPARSFTVLGGEGFNLTAPANNFETKPGRDEKSMAIDFSWSRSPIDGNYFLELSREPDFSRIVHGAAAGATGAKVGEVTPGTYYWRVKVYDADRTELFRSGTRALVVREADKTPGKATVIISSTAERGAVYVNGKLAGYGKVTINPDPGTMNVSVTADGFKKYEKELIIKAGEKQELRAELEKIPEKATVVVYSSAARGAVYVNGALAGYGTVTVRPDPGMIKIAVVSAGYKKFEKELVIRAGEKQEIRAELELIRREAEVRAKAGPDVAIAVKTAPVPAALYLKGAGGAAVKPLVHNDVLVTTTAGGVITGVSQTGGPGWKANLGSRVESTPVADDSGIYVVTTKGELVSMDGRTGAVRWKKDSGGPVLFSSRPLIAENKIFVATSYGNVSAFARDGRELWRKKLGGGVFSSPAYDDGMLYLGTDDRKLNALLTKDGRTRWQFETDSRMVATTPLVFRGNVYIGCYSGSFYAVNARSGRLSWQFRATRPILSSSVARDNLVFTGSLDGFLYALNAGNGSLAWKYSTGERIMMEPVLGNGKIFLASQKTFHVIAVDSGASLWKVDLKQNIKTPPTPVGADVLVGLDNGEMVTLRPDQQKVVR